MFQVRPNEGYRWIIVDEEDRQVFEGTWRQCESWLDAQENAGVPRPVGLFGRCWRALFRDHTSRPADVNGAPHKPEAVSADPIDEA